MRTVLVVRLDSAGDVLLAGPGVRAVAARADRVVLLAGPRGRDAAALLPGWTRSSSGAAQPAANAAHNARLRTLKCTRVSFQRRRTIAIRYPGRPDPYAALRLPVMTTSVTRLTAGR